MSRVLLSALRGLHLGGAPTRVSVPKYVPCMDVGQLRFAGHSKWSKIKHAKGDADAKKSAINTKVSKEIVSSVKGSWG